jgi:predicted enzyme related to lactoylglutathione lyase
MKAKAVDFVYYTVRDVANSVPFYRDTLGLELESLSEEGLGWAEFAAPPTTLSLVGATPDGPEPGAGGTAIALAVDDVEGAVEELRKEGTTVVMDPLETGACTMAVVTDPDGNPVMLHRRDDGTYGRVDPLPEYTE